MGRGYVIDCCIAAINHQRARENFEVYISDIGAALIKMFAKDADIPRYYDLLHPKPKDTRTGAEIAAEVIKRHNLKAVD